MDAINDSEEKKRRLPRNDEAEKAEKAERKEKGEQRTLKVNFFFSHKTL